MSICLWFVCVAPVSHAFKCKFENKVIQEAQLCLAQISFSCEDYFPFFPWLSTVHHRDVGTGVGTNIVLCCHFPLSSYLCVFNEALSFLLACLQQCSHKDKYSRFFFNAISDVCACIENTRVQKSFREASSKCAQVMRASQLSGLLWWCHLCTRWLLHKTFVRGLWQVRTGDTFRDRHHAGRIKNVQ